MGLYLLIEPINIGLYRLSFPEFSLLSGETAYIVGRERIGMAENEFRSYGYYAGKTSYLLHIDYPKSHKITHGLKLRLTAVSFLQTATGLTVSCKTERLHSG